MQETCCLILITMSQYGTNASHSCLALDDGNVEEAHHIHVSLMVDFVAEVGIRVQ